MNDTELLQLFKWARHCIIDAFNDIQSNNLVSAGFNLGEVNVCFKQKIDQLEKKTKEASNATD